MWQHIINLKRKVTLFAVCIGIEMDLTSASGVDPADYCGLHFAFCKASVCNRKTDIKPRS